MRNSRSTYRNHWGLEMRVNTYLTLTIVFIVCIASPAVAESTSATGAVTVVSPPASVIQNTYESNNEIRLFQERLSVALVEDIGVDISVPSTINSIDDFSPSVVPEGTIVSSTYVIFDPIGTTTMRTLSGSVSFDQNIIGIIYRTASLTPTHLALGNSDTTYQMTNDIGAYGADYGQDPVTLTTDRHTVVFTFSADSSADSIRIITAAPEPSLLVMLLASAVTLLVGRRR